MERIVFLVSLGPINGFSWANQQIPQLSEGTKVLENVFKVISTFYLQQPAGNCCEHKAALDDSGKREEILIRIRSTGVEIINSPFVCSSGEKRTDESNYEPDNGDNCWWNPIFSWHFGIFWIFFKVKHKICWPQTYATKQSRIAGKKKQITWQKKRIFLLFSFSWVWQR